jgi:type I restriction enzyme S subunit
VTYSLTKLGDICDLLNGYAFKSKDYIDKSNTLSCRMSNIRPNGNFDIDYNARYLPNDFAEEYKQFLLKDDDVVIAMTDLADSPKILGVPTVIETNGRNILLNQRVGKLAIRDSNKVYFPYLQFALNSPSVRSVYKRFAGGGLQINLGKADLLSVEIPLPPLAEQQKIAEILDAADSLRKKDQQLIDHYASLSQSLFLEMFGDPVTNPMGWGFTPLNDLVTKLGDGLHGTPVYSDEGEYYFVNGNNLQDGELVVSSTTKKVTQSEFEKHKKELGGSTILVSINGSIGKVAFYRGENIVLGKSACYFNVQEKLINKNYLFHVIQAPYFLRYALGKATGSTIKNVSLKTMREFPIPLPPMTIQNEFIERIQAIEAQKQQAQASLGKSNDLFNSLLQRAFSGELTGSKAA